VGGLSKPDFARLKLLNPNQRSMRQINGMNAIEAFGGYECLLAFPVRHAAKSTLNAR